MPNDNRVYLPPSFYQQQSMFNLSLLQSPNENEQSIMPPQLQHLFEINFNNGINSNMALNDWSQQQIQVEQQQQMQVQQQQDTTIQQQQPQPLPLLNQPYLQYYQQYFNNYPHLQQEWQK